MIYRSSLGSYCHYLTSPKPASKLDFPSPSPYLLAATNKTVSQKMKIPERYGQHLLRNSRNGWISLLWLLFAIFFTAISIFYGDAFDSMVGDQKGWPSAAYLPTLKTLVIIMATMMYFMALGFFQQWCIWRSVRNLIPDKERG